MPAFRAVQEPTILPTTSFGTNLQQTEFRDTARVCYHGLVNRSAEMKRPLETGGTLIVRRCPASLGGAVDRSITRYGKGGDEKTAFVDFVSSATQNLGQKFKQMIGVFWQPNTWILDVETIGCADSPLLGSSKNPNANEPMWWVDVSRYATWQLLD